MNSGKMHDFHRDGILVYNQFLCNAEIIQYQEALSSYECSSNSAGIRHIEQKVPIIQRLIELDKVQKLASDILNDQPMFIRAIYFNKTLENNWNVSWHQDKTIMLEHQFEHPQWGPWSLKENALHVQPPCEVLDNMVTFRIHLDSCNKNNGCLKVIKGSHLHGIKDATEVVEYARNSNSTLCEVEAGDLLAMKPHIIHASNKALMPSNRRVVHLEFLAKSFYPSNL